MCNYYFFKPCCSFFPYVSAFLNSFKWKNFEVSFLKNRKRSPMPGSPMGNGRSNHSGWKLISAGCFTVAAQGPATTGSLGFEPRQDARAAGGQLTGVRGGPVRGRGADCVAGAGERGLHLSRLQTPG